jgi:hypothetical protein
VPKWTRPLVKRQPDTDPRRLRALGDLLARGQIGTMTATGERFDAEAERRRLGTWTICK